MRELGQTVKYIPQEDIHGCGIAVLAMLTGKSYQDVRAEFQPRYIEKGMTEWSMNAYLAEHGYAVAHKYPHYMPQLKHRDVWPPEPFAPMHYCCMLTPNNTHHYVVMLADGSIVDPATSKTQAYKDYTSVQNVAGVMRMSLKVRDLVWALQEVNRRICDDSKPLVDFLNAHKGEPGQKEAGEAYKWAVYGTAIHAQIALVGYEYINPVEGMPPKPSTHN
jgi:hypothetical protein